MEKRRKELQAAKAVDSVKLEDKILIELRVLQNRLFGSPQHKRFAHTNPMARTPDLARELAKKNKRQQPIPQVSRFSMRAKALSQENLVPKPR